jgi:hypothetical protein
MTTLHTPEAHNNFNTTSIPDEKFRELIDLGFTVKEIEKLHAMQEYRRDYNSRPEVKAKRALYNQVRYERMKQIRGLLK